MGCTVPPPGPVTPTNTPPELSDFIFPSMHRDIFLNKNIYYFPGARVSYKDPEGNLGQLVLTFRQGIISSSLIGQVTTYSTAGTLTLNGFVRNAGSPGLDVFSPGTVTVSIQAIDRAGARSNVLTTTFVLL